MSNRIGQGKIMLFLTLLLLLSIAACGPNPVTPQPSTGGDTPVGIGTTPEPGTNGKPLVSPTGHWESIVAVNGIAYVGSDNGTLYALRASDGAVRWQYDLGSTVSISTVLNGVVYAFSVDDPTLYALNANTGALIWRHQVSKPIIAALVVDGVVYVNTDASGNSSLVYALRISDGALLWHATIASVTPGLFSVVNGTVYFIQVLGDIIRPNESLYALQASNGHVLWRAHIDGTDGLVSGAPAVIKNVVYLAANHGAIYALRTDTGAQLWHIAHPTGPGFIAGPVSPTVVNSIIYIRTGQNVDALRASDGTLLWENKGNLSFGPIVEQPEVVNGVVYVGSNSGLVAALRADTGATLWRHTGIFVYGPLTVADGMVYTNTPDSLYALRASDGSQVWQRTLKNHSMLSSLGSPEVVADGIVYVGTDDGHVQALAASDGRLLWHYAIQEKGDPQEAGPIYSAAVTFTSSTSYEQALQFITDLGLQTFYPCSFSWHPQSDKDGSFQLHSLLVISTVSGAPLWVNRLKASPSVDSLVGNPVFSCPLERPGKIPFLPPEKAGTYVQVTFSDTVKNYDTVLDAINNLGFRLANPCYEQARARGAKPMWSSVGQEGSFGKTHTLLLATTHGNSVQWMEQLQRVSGVVKVEAPFVVTC